MVVLSESATLGDAAATAIGNLIRRSEDIPSGIEFAEGIEGLKGLVIIIHDRMGLWGDVKICETSQSCQKKSNLMADATPDYR